jgi:2-amino-4-hydroxy-6-hydroxymethyldihydropteridine diphosphokinase
LLDIIHQIEGAAGRVRKERWGDRTLDIDIVFFGDKIIRQRGLSIPHPDYANRDFVLTPIKEIAPDFVCPLTGKRMSDM